MNELFVKARYISQKYTFTLCLVLPGCALGLNLTTHSTHVPCSAAVYFYYRGDVNV